MSEAKILASVVDDTLKHLDKLLANTYDWLPSGYSYAVGCADTCEDLRRRIRSRLKECGYNSGSSLGG